MVNWIGQEAVMQEVEKHDCENTIVIFSSDNGPVYGDGYADGSRKRDHNAAGPFRGGKYQIYEAGTRVPFIVRWPKKTNQKSDLVSQIDLLASFAALVVWLGAMKPSTAATHTHF